MDWAFLRLFSADGLGLNLWKFEKLEKLKKLSFGCHFGRKRREKSREISVKFENLEKKMSKWTRLFPVDGLKTKIIL